MLHHRSTTLTSLLGLLLSLLVHNALAIGVTFTAPGAGASWPAGPIIVNWTDGGGNPNINNLTLYVLDLMVGGNTDADSEAITRLHSGQGYVSDMGVEGTIAADVAQSVENGFYFRMTSNTTDGNQVINYSNRFTLTKMNGSTNSIYLDGANAATGSSDVPGAQYNVRSSPTASASSTISAPLSSATITATSSPTSESDSDDIGMDTGAKVAIAVGGCLALIGLASVFGWAYIFYRHKKRKQQQEPPARKSWLSSRGDPLGHKAELHSDSTFSSRTTFPLELSPTDERHEALGREKPVEAARASIYELESDWTGWEVGTGRRSVQPQKPYDPTAF